jgi:hypothetical protein
LTLTGTTNSELEIDLSAGYQPPVSFPPYVIIPYGQSTITIPLDTALVTESGLVTLRARHATTTKEASLTVLPPAANHVEALSLATAEAVGGDLVAATVTLDQPAGAGGVAVDLTSNDTSRAIVPSTVTVAEGST